jgi:hypothetical protein
MSKKFYTGVDNVARLVVKPYAEDGGVARLVTQGYIGVDGVARQMFNPDNEPRTYQVKSGIRGLDLFKFIDQYGYREVSIYTPERYDYRIDIPLNHDVGVVDVSGKSKTIYAPGAFIHGYFFFMDDGKYTAAVYFRANNYTSGGSNTSLYSNIRHITVSEMEAIIAGTGSIELGSKYTSEHVNTVTLPNPYVENGLALEFLDTFMDRV